MIVTWLNIFNPQKMLEINCFRKFNSESNASKVNKTTVHNQTVVLFHCKESTSDQIPFSRIIYINSHCLLTNYYSTNWKQNSDQPFTGTHPKDSHDCESSSDISVLLQTARFDYRTSFGFFLTVHPNSSSVLIHLLLNSPIS
uniref:ZP domain-containing protein n=1 Tax=Heterorhabditis bacteriophora TaxID=37862 RepID=A0A1I7WFJ1_HETBA